MRLPRLLTLRPRLTAAAGFGLAAGLLLPGAWPATTRLLTGWNLGVLAYLAVIWTVMIRSGPERMRQRAKDEDEQAPVVLAVAVLATAASLAGLTIELMSTGQASAVPEGMRLALAAGTILDSWFFVHTLFTLHYAYAYYGTGEGRGLGFPEGTPRPDYWDFAYFAFTIGAAAQTSDVTVTARGMRKIVLAQTVVAFLFNTTVLALAVNVGASLIGGH